VARLSLSLSLLAAMPVVGSPAAAQTPGRTIEITGGDDMKYSVTTINAKPGEALHIRLSAKGAMPKIAMSHNIVILKPKTDVQAFATAAANARATNFVPPALKDEVIAASTLVGNGETTDLKFTAPKAPGTYPFICTFPGHFLTMKGTLVVK
jgi:azurin